jgi:hypothetical protein
MQYISSHSLLSHEYILIHALQLSNVHVLVSPGTSLVYLRQSKCLVEYLPYTSITQLVVDIEMDLLDQNLDLSLFLYHHSQECPWTYNPSFQISEGSLLLTFLVQGILHHASAILLVRSNNA